MPLKTKTLLVVFLVTLSISFLHAEHETNPAVANNQLTIDLYQQLKTEKGNVFYSPYSVTSAVAALTEGAKGNTAKQLENFLHGPASLFRDSFSKSYQTTAADQPYILSVANGLWMEKTYPISEDYIRTVKESYGAEAKTMDFKGDADDSREEINKWVETKTRDKIKDLFPEDAITDATRLVIANAIYFKGTWLTAFDKADTQENGFLLKTGKTVRVPFMKNKALFSYGETDDMQIIELPYKGNKLSMFVFLPKNNDIDAFEKLLSWKQIVAWKEKMNRVQVNLFLPKFKFETKYVLTDTMKKMGVTDAFAFPAADFTGMDKTKQLFVDLVIHQATVEVNEEGSEMAAATGIAMLAGSAMPIAEPDPVIFKADHPFLFIVQDTTTGTILFIGRVENPKL